MIYSIVKKVKSFIKEKINFVSQSKIYKLIIEKIDYIQVKYFHKGELKRFVLIKYLFKDLVVNGNSRVVILLGSFFMNLHKTCQPLLKMLQNN